MTDIRRHDAEHVISRWNTVFEALSAEPRRQIIAALLQADGDEQVSLPESAINPNAPVDTDELLVELYHCHLPRLSEADLVEWEQEPFVASRGPRFREAVVVFESLYSRADEIPDSLVVGCRRLELKQQQESLSDTR